MRLLVYVILCWQVTLAHSYTGNELYKALGDHPDFYAGYVLATFERVRNQGWNGQCVSAPDDVTLKQAMDVVQKYLEDNPGVRHRNAAWLVNEALSEVFGTYEATKSNWCF